MNLAVAMPVCNRPHYLSPVLESWRDVRGISDVPMFFRCEPGYPDMPPLVRRERPAGPGEVVVNGECLGNDQNMKAAITSAFAGGADFVAAAEDDVMVSADLLEYMTWAAGAYTADRQVLAVCTHQDAPPGPLDEVRRTAWFWGGSCWGMWRDRWNEVSPGWPPSGSGYDGYLWPLVQAGRVCIQPLATRCKNIGEIGVNTRGDSFQAAWDRQQFTPDVPPQSYRELAGLYGPDGRQIR